MNSRNETRRSPSSALEKFREEQGFTVLLRLTKQRNFQPFLWCEVRSARGSRYAFRWVVEFIRER